MHPLSNLLPMTHRLELNREVHFYEISADEASLKGFHTALFADPSNRPLCTEIKKARGKDMPGCEDAAAYTSWKFRLAQNQLYDTDGKKKSIHAVCESVVTLPKFSLLSEVEDEDEVGEIRRFLARTAYHEAGHSEACEQLGRTVIAFAEAMPAEVEPKDVEPLNEGFKMVVFGFYVPSAQAADKFYDNNTDHGAHQGAELWSRPNSENTGVGETPSPPMKRAVLSQSSRVKKEPSLSVSVRT